MGVHRNDDGQLDLFGEDPRVTRWREFHAENPAVYREFKRRCLLALERQHRPRFGSQTVLESIRWDTSVMTHDPDGWKVNNNWAAFYARLFMFEHPEYAGRIEVRESVADSAFPRRSGRA